LVQVFKEDKNIPPDMRDKFVERIEREVRREVFIGDEDKNLHSEPTLVNVFVSECFSCREVSVWFADSVAHPPLRHGVEPNADLPPDIVRDYEEARSIVRLSPRGAAALLRLAIQKLCVHLGESGEKLDVDIASLVKKGLDVRVQKALDIVRVIGNESVHAGQMDLRDDPGTATKLFDLVNLIADIMISQPKHVADIYGALPASKLAGIAERDKPKA